MKIRGKLLPATQRSNSKFKKVRENTRAASETEAPYTMPEEYRNIPRCVDIFRASFGTHSSSTQVRHGIE